MSEVFLLGGDLGKDVLKEFEAITNDPRFKLREHPALKTTRYNDEKGIVVGANVPSNVLVGELLEKRGYVLADISDLLKAGDLNMGAENYTYSDLLIKSEGLPNLEIAKSLIAQAKHFGLDKVPFIVPLNRLRLLPSQNCHGLDFLINSLGSIRTLEIFKKDADFKYNILDNAGYPIPDENGKNKWINAYEGVYAVGVGSEGAGAQCRVFQDPNEHPSNNTKIAGGNSHGLIFIKKK